MPTFLYLMKNDAAAQNGDDAETWQSFIEKLKASSQFIGGGSLGEGCIRRGETITGDACSPIVGFMVITAENLDAAREMLDDCPTIQQGGSVEIREVPDT